MVISKRLRPNGWHGGLPVGVVLPSLWSHFLCTATALLLLIGGNDVGLVLASGLPAGPAWARVGLSHQACGEVGRGHAKCLAALSNTSATDPARLLPASGGGYGPAEFHTAYQLPCTPGGPVQAVCATPGSYGPQTVAIVDAGGYGSGGTLESALQAYDTYYGLPACTAANGCLTVVNQAGTSSPLPPMVNSGWSAEIALDVEAVHMICQTCKIVLVEANDDTIGNLAIAEDTAVTFNPVAISNSWGSSFDISFFDSHFKHAGVAILAATGDNGNDDTGQSWPADIPEVVAVSGTNLQLNVNNTRASETVWSGSGGGCSTTYTAPGWQSSLSEWPTNGCSSGGRAFGDISADADPNTGAAIYIGSSWYVAGGTSLATPIIAAMYALADSLPATANAVSLLYQHRGIGDFYDVTAGNDCTSLGQAYCTATTGFDAPSGLGVPNGLDAFQGDPAAPTNVTATSVGQTEIDLSWTAAITTNGVQNYQIYRDNLLRGSTAATTYSDTGLAPNTTYTYYLTTTDTLGSISGKTPNLSTNTYLLPDINQDGHVNLLDFSLLASKYNQSGGALGRSDINHDGVVNLLDFSLLAAKYGTE